MVAELRFCVTLFLVGRLRQCWKGDIYRSEARRRDPDPRQRIQSLGHDDQTPENYFLFSATVAINNIL